MTTSPRYLDEKLSPVIDPEKARFEETDLFLRLYSADVFDDVATLYKEDVGSGPSWKGAVVFANGGWHETLDKQGVSFQKTQFGWTAVLGKQSVTILPDCDPRDAATWLTSFLQITKSSTGVGKIQLLENAEFVLGGNDDDFKALAAAGHNSVQFFNHQGSGRLFATAVETVTRERPKPTSVMNVIAHEAAHLFREKLQPQIATVTELVLRAFLDDEAAKNRVIDLTVAIHADYLFEYFRAAYQAAASLEYNQKTLSYKNPTIVSRADLAASTAEEIVVEAFGRYTLCQETFDRKSSAEASQLLDALAEIILEPTILPGNPRNKFTQKMLAPAKFESSLARALTQAKSSKADGPEIG